MSVVKKLNDAGVMHAISPQCPACTNYISKFGKTALTAPLRCVDVSKRKNMQWAQQNNITHTPTALYADGTHATHNETRTPQKLLNAALKKHSKFGQCPPGGKDPIPQNGPWFSGTMWNNRAGNAIPCMESAKRLFVDKSPRVPRLSSFGNPFTSKAWYNHRGTNGFDGIPKGRWKFQGGPMFNYAETPQSGYPKAGSALPRPYQNRDQAVLAGFPKPPRKNAIGTRKKKKGTRKKRVRRTSQYFGRPAAITGHGWSAGLAPSMGWVKTAKPHRNWDPAFQKVVPQKSYLPGWMPQQYQEPYGTSPLQKEIADGAKKVFSSHIARVSNFGNLYRAMGPNNVAYNPPFLAYPGAGANGYDFLTRTNYLPQCGKNPNWNRVQKNNNPRGFLANKNTKTVKGLSFGAEGPWSPSESQIWAKTPMGPNSPYQTSTVNQLGTGGPGIIGDPLELYSYQNTNLGNFIPQEKLNPRAWKGGYGSKKKKTKKRKKKKRKARRKIKPGDTLKFGRKGTIKVIKKRK